MTLLLDQPPISHDTVAAIVADTCAGLFGEFSEQPIPDSIGESGMDAEAMGVHHRCVGRTRPDRLHASSGRGRGGEAAAGRAD